MVPLEQDEIIIKEVRKHWFFIISEVVFNIAAALFPLFLIVGIRAMSSADAAIDIVIALVILYPIWLMMVWISFFYFWTDYYLDVLVVTNKRIIDIEQHGLFNRQISSFPLENIQDITTDVAGIVATFLDFGNVTLQTASEKSNFIITNAAHPETVKKVIQEAHDKVLETLRDTRV